MNTFEWRVAIAVAISIGVVWFLLSWTAPEVPARSDVIHGIYVLQMKKWGPDALTYAWYGPALLMLIPGMFFWIGFNTDSREEAFICIGFGLVLILIFGFAIWHANQPMVF